LSEIRDPLSIRLGGVLHKKTPRVVRVNYFLEKNRDLEAGKDRECCSSLVIVREKQAWKDLAGDAMA